MSVWQAAKQAALVISPVAALVMDSVEKSSAAVRAASERSLEDLKAEVAKQEVRLRFELQQAKIAQELAIAQRILNAETVEIEEFYDRSGKGSLGAQYDGEVASIGLAAEGKSVTKRIYHFKGRSDGSEVETDQTAE